MVTDDERREVAQRLRKLDYADLQESLICAYLDVLGIKGYEDWVGIAHRLADLIDPPNGFDLDTVQRVCSECMEGCDEPEWSLYTTIYDAIVRYKREKGWLPHNLYSLYKAVLRRRPRNEFTIEDDEVNELIDALLNICNVPGHELIQRPQPSCDRDALLAMTYEMDAYTKCDDERCGREMPPRVIHGFASRIREALGVFDSGQE